MKSIAEGDYEADVPYLERRNEMGEMARAVEVFRENGLKVSAMTVEERAASERRRIERTDMMVALQAAFGEVVDAAIAGDFSKRVHAQFPDRELNSLPPASMPWWKRWTGALGKPAKCLQPWRRRI
jgi:methyl-accepting chemotaxis protein